MKFKHLFSVIVVLSSLIGTWAYGQSPRAQRNLPDNPVAVRGDPFLLHASNGYYYLYGSSEGVNYLTAYKSKDLLEWEFIGEIYRGGTPGSWVKNELYAPEMLEYNGKYYLFFSANPKNQPESEKEYFRLGVAVSDSPEGPFKDMYDKPIFDTVYPAIDVSVLHDEDTGKFYIYYSRCCYKHPVKSQLSRWAKKNKIFDYIEESWVYGAELKPDFSGIIGKPKLLLRPPKRMGSSQEWEDRSVLSHEVNRRWTEGPFCFKENGLYYMLYSCNRHLGPYYGVGYATSKSPLGPFTKGDNPIVEKTERLLGPGHCMALKDGDRWLIVYHGKAEETKGIRFAFIDEMFVKDGHIKVDGPTFTNPDFPQGPLKLLGDGNK